MISPYPKDFEVRQLCKDFIRMFPGKSMDAMEASIEMQERWGIRLDWHEFSFALDEMSRKGEVQTVGHNTDGMTQYRIK